MYDLDIYDLEINIAFIIMCIITSYMILIKKCSKKERNFLCLLTLPCLSFTILDLINFDPFIKWIVCAIFFSIFYIWGNIVLFKDRETLKFVKYKLAICDILILTIIILVIVIIW